MKKLLLIFGQFLFFIPIVICQGESCGQSITLNSQSDVNNFHINFPDCDSVDSLKIIGSDITSLDSLIYLENVLEFTLIDGTSLVDLDGLSRIDLSEVHVFIVNDNDDLLFVPLLSHGPRLDTFIVTNNASLIGFNGDIFFSEYVEISNNPSLDGCCILQEVYEEGSAELVVGNNGSNCSAIQSIREECENCDEHDFSLRSQEEVDNFRFDYPSCRHLLSLEIRGEDITDIDGLSHIESIELDLVIRNTSLTDLGPLSNIGVDVRHFEIIDNTLLETIDFPLIDSTVDDLDIRGNPSLVEIKGLANGLDIHFIYVRNNESLTNLNGFSGLNNVRFLSIENNDAMENIDGLSGLNMNRINLEVIGNDNLSTCCVLQEIFIDDQSHDNSFEIRDNAAGCNSSTEIISSCEEVNCHNEALVLRTQEEVDAFPITYRDCDIFRNLSIIGVDIANLDSLIYLEFVTASISIQETSLEDLEGISHLDLSEVTQYRFIDNQELISVTDIDFGESIDTMIVLGNGSITSIANLGYTDHANYIQINRNELLVEIPLFESIREADHVSIFDNINLDECCGLFELIDRDNIVALTLSNNGDNCSSTQIIRELCGHCESFEISLGSQESVDNFRRNNPSCTELFSLNINGSDITNLDSLYYLSSVAVMDLTIENTSLTNLDGISHVSIDVDYVEIVNNPFLETINIPNLEIRDDLRIADNRSLKNVDGLISLDGVRSLQIVRNVALTDLDGLARLQVGHDITIKNNTTLTDISGLRRALDNLLDQLTIVGNISLSDCCILEEYFDFEHPHEEIDFEISDNASECNSIEDIISSCEGVSCEIDELVLTTQNEVNTFPINYPNCSVFRSLRIVGNDITNLDSLYLIENIFGEFTLENTGVTNFDGLSLGEDIDDLYIVNNELLTSLRMPTNISSISGRAIIQNNDLLTNLDGFADLETIGFLSIDDNDGILNLEYFDNLRSINNFYLANNNSLSDCCLLDDILDTGIRLENITIENNADGCNDLLEVNENCFCPSTDLQFESQSTIDSFSLLYPNCTQVSSISINGSASQVTSLEALSRVHINSIFNVISTDVESLDGLNFGPEIDYFSFQDNLQLSEIDAFLNLTRINSHSNIHSTAITNLAAFENLEHAFLRFQDNDQLTDISGLRNLKTYEELTFSQNINLSECCFLNSQLQDLPNSGVLTFLNNGDGCSSRVEIESECNEGFSCASEEIRLNSQRAVDEFVANHGACSSVDRLFITGRDIVNLDGISSLQKVNERLTVRGPGLVDLSGLSHIDLTDLDEFGVLDNLSLQTLDGVILSDQIRKVVISNNPRLSSIDALASLRAYEYLEIENNNSLAECCPVLQALDKPSDARLFVRRNAYGCKSIEDVTSSCEEVEDFDCLNIVLTSQEEIDNFSKDYPGCDTLRSLRIQGADITNLDGLSSIRSVEIEFVIIDTKISDFSGLTNTTFQDLTFFRILSNHQLLSLEGPNYTSNIRFIRIENNDSLEDLVGFEDLRQIEVLNLVFNDNLISLEGIEAVDTIHDLEIVRNDLLTDISQLRSTYIGQISNIRLNASLTDCCALTPIAERDVVNDNGVGCRSIMEIIDTCDDPDTLDCSEVDLVLITQAEVDDFPRNYPGCTEFNNLTIEGQDITRLNSLIQLRRINGKIELTNTSLEFIDGLYEIESATSVVITDNTKLRSLRGFEGVKDLSGTLIISNNDLITDLSGVNFYESISTLEIVDNDQLTQIDYFNNLTFIDRVFIGNNSSLSDCCVLFQFNSLGADQEDIYVENNAEGCQSLENISDVCGDENISCDIDRITLRSQAEVDDFQSKYQCNEVAELIITGLDIENLDGLASLTMITEKIEIEETSLADLNGLMHIEMGSVSKLEIRENEILENLEGISISENMDRVVVSDNSLLQNIESLEPLRTYEYVEIFGNNILSSCCPIFIALAHTDGRMVIRQNADGCNGSSDIEETCDDPPMTDCTEIILNSQADVDNYSRTYGGCTIVDILHINGPDITSIDGIIGLEKINVELFIGETQLTDLNVLAGVEFDSLQIINIFNNDQLISLNGVMFSSHVEEINIDENEVLMDLNGLALLESVGHLGISFNNGLEELLGLEGIISIEHLLITENPQLRNLDYLMSIEHIDFGDIFENTSLADCCILLPFVQEDNGNVSVGDNAIGCNAASDISRECQDVQIIECENDNVILTSQQEVDDFEANYGTCNSVNTLEIKGLDINNLEGLANLAEVKEYVMVSNTNLADLRGLANVVFDSAQFIIIRRNPNLTEIDGLRSGEHLAHIKITNNPALINLGGLQNLRTSDYLGIENNNGLIDLGGLENVMRINRLSITNNAVLQSFAGLENLELVESLSAYFNPQLADVEALSDLRAYDLLHVNYNAQLSACCGLMLAIESREEGDYLGIGNNLPGCNSIAEVVDDCTITGFKMNEEQNSIVNSNDLEDVSLSLLDGIDGNDRFNVFPNPFDNNLLIKHPKDFGEAQLRLFDIRGVLILSKKITSSEEIINTSTFNPGVYLLQFAGSEFSQTIKLVKQ